ncbi:MAG TPA: flagellar hook protein FlgE [Rhodocyclaceae bacterium]|nr:flagellar hook protein FlgE [Rhodocyclaceae bacterium]HRQ45306.1 flagellar hook protein FlgE [Rhodocyclaceae bacterium]
MAFQQGLSGLNSSSKAIDVVSNNIANANTVGFKASTAQFADVYASSLTGTVGSIQIGIGSSVNAVRQAFSQGNLTSTNSPLDMAINGNGFFEVALRDGTFALTRNGQFDIDADGYIVTALGDRLMGYQETDPLTGDVRAPANPTNANYQALFIPPTGIRARATDDVTIGANLSAQADIIAASPPVLTDASSYSYTTAIRVYDSLGVDHSLSLYFVKSAPQTWDVYTSVDGSAPANPPLGTLGFASDGTLSSGNLQNLAGIDFGNGSAIFNTQIDFSRMTQFGSGSVVKELSQNGYSDGEIAGLSISKNGVIQGRYTNGQTQDIGIVGLVTVRSPNGMSSLGNNLWRDTPESGDPVRGPAGVGLNGVISAGMVEDSNVDLTQELVQLIIQQRNYQANAQSIRTQDQILQTLVNLR